MKKYFPLLFCFFIALSVFAQTSNKKRVLVIPPSRFEFVSEFTLEVIAEKNGIKTSEVFTTYKKELLSSFGSYQDENFEFVPVDEIILKPYKKYIKYKYGKFNRKPYNAVDLKRFSKEEFTNLLEQYNADFVIFITWYDIQKEAFSRKHSKRVKYAAHYIDFDIYNLFKQQVIGMAKVQAEAPKPNDLEASFTLLRIKELKLAYVNFIGKVIAQLNKPIEQK